MAKKKPANGRANGRSNGKKAAGKKKASSKKADLPKAHKPKKKPLPAELDPDPAKLPNTSSPHMSEATKEQVEKKRATIEKRRRISVMLLHGWSDRDISHKLQISIGETRSHIKHLRKAWMRNASGAVEGHISQMIAQQDLVIMKALQGWDRSLEDEVTQTREWDDEHGQKLKETRKGQAGDPRFLDLVNKSNQRKMDLLGILHGKTAEQQAQKRFADGYGVVLVELATPAEVKVAQGMQEFRHQFVGFGEDDENTVDAEEYNQVEPKEPPPDDTKDPPTPG